MLRHGDTFRQASEYVNSENAATQHRIQLAKSVLLITLPEIPGGRNTMTVINTGAHPMEPVFTREVA
ncbi:MAG: hypothetical protein F4Y63_09210 [Chloroflexi bacterium]|nr:hypothetical protein [Chloroflexota bacterium]MYK61582.1 hypothetical protein [Chloroflexota bacterium]